MSYTATRFAPSVRYAQTLEEELADSGYMYDGRQVYDLVSEEIRKDDRKVYESDIARIAEMEEEEFFAYILPLSRGAKYIAGRIYAQCHGAYRKEVAIASVDLNELASDWAAKKELSRYLYQVPQEDLNKMSLSIADNGSCKLMNINIRFAWQARRFMDLYKQICNSKRPWGSCYQPPKGKIKAIALTPNYNRLPLWVKQVLIQSPHWIQTERVGDIWKLIPAAKAWKVCPELPKAIAIRVGKMPLWKRLAAKAVWYELNCSWIYFAHYSRMGESRAIQLYGETSEELSRPEFMMRFWSKFSDFCAQGMDAVLMAAGDVSRAIAIKTKGLNNSQAKLLSVLLTEVAGQTEQSPIGLLQGLKVGAFWKSFNPNSRNFIRFFGEDVSLKECKKSIELQWDFKANLAGVLVFGKELSRWFEKQDSLGRGYHDASYWLPIAPVRQLEGLSRWLFKFGDRNIAELEIVSKRWQHLSATERSLPYKELLNLCRSQKYSGVNSPEFAQEAGQWGIEQHNYTNWESRFIASLQTPMPFPTDKVWKAGDITGKFLERSDVRGLFLGQYTNCCQHPDGVGQACAWYGQESPNSGFFVWESKGEIIAQSWCWVSDDGGVCFDNVEAKGLGDAYGGQSQRSNEVAAILSSVAKSLSEHFHSITLGTGLSDLDTSRWQYSNILLQSPHDYSGYKDSSNQVLLFHNPRLPKRKMMDVPAWTRGATSEDWGACEAIALACYPQGWQFAASEETDYGIILDSSERKLIGYAAFETANRYISDIAVHPKFRKYSMTLIKAVLAYCRDGQWECEARESTSYRVLRSLEKRGKVKIFSADISQYMGDEPMYLVKFEVQS